MTPEEIHNDTLAYLNALCGGDVDGAAMLLMQMGIEDSPEHVRFCSLLAGVAAFSMAALGLLVQRVHGVTDDELTREFAVSIIADMAAEAADGGGNPGE